MWKYICRGIRETFERRINFRQKDKAAGQECPIGAIQNKLIPGIVSRNKFDSGTSDLGGKCKNGPCNDKKRQNGERWRHNGGIQEPVLLGALGWVSGNVYYLLFISILYIATDCMLFRL
jgi:hypothetical protein